MRELGDRSTSALGPPMMPSTHPYRRRELTRLAYWGATLIVILVVALGLVHMDLDPGFSKSEGGRMRTRILWAFIMSLLWISGSLPAQAQSPETVADVRCVLVGMRFAQMPNPTLRTSGFMLALYYIGRLDGREPKLDIEKLIIDQVTNMTNADYAHEAVRCGTSLTTKGQQVTRIGQDLVKRGQEMQKQAPSEGRSAN